MTPIELRRRWMTEQGLSQAEIDKSIADLPPTDIDYEQENLDAVFEMRQTDKLSWLPKLIDEIKRENGLTETSPNWQAMVCIACRGLVDRAIDGTHFCKCKIGVQLLRETDNGKAGS